MPRASVNRGQQHLERQFRHGLLIALEAFPKLILPCPHSVPARHDATAPSQRQRGRRKWHLAAAVRCRGPLDSLVMRRCNSNGSAPDDRHLQIGRRTPPASHEPSRAPADVCADRRTSALASGRALDHPGGNEPWCNAGPPGPSSTPRSGRQDSHRRALRRHSNSRRAAPAVSTMSHRLLPSILRQWQLVTFSDLPPQVVPSCG